MDSIQLKIRITARLSRTIETIMLFKNSTVRRLAAALDTPERSPSGVSQTGYLVENDTGEPVARDEDYEPVVVLRAAGSKAPFWLVHPAIGEVLGFVDLARHLAEDDRPVYALRARGLKDGERTFSTMIEAVSTYLAAVQQRQPHGPYVLAGYSYGAILVFEIAKSLESAGETVGFLGSFDHAPHIHDSTRRPDWNMGLLKVADFLDLVDEKTMNGMAADNAKTSREAPRTRALSQVLARADRKRLRELHLDEASLTRWVNVTYNLLVIAVGYEPAGHVGCIDVFHAEALRSQAASRDEWVRRQSQWKDFCRTEPRLHRADGGHYTLLGPEHMAGFAVTLRSALRARDV